VSLTFGCGLGGGEEGSEGEGMVGRRVGRRAVRGEGMVGRRGVRGEEMVGRRAWREKEWWGGGQ